MGHDPREEILGSFRGVIRPVKVAPLYLSALAIVALAMVLLPLLYLVLISGVVWGALWYAIHGWPLLAGIDSWRSRAFVFLAPLVCGAILILFMIKPLFAPRAQFLEPKKKLSPEDEPLLFAFVDRVCEAVGAPRPREICVDGQVNASASLRRGLLSLFSDDLVLTLGLPLVVGLSLPQLAGVLAHELGHFSQRAALRLSYVINRVNAWFARVVYERDQWDEELTRWARSSNLYLQIALWVAIGFVWLTRKILWALMMAGRVLSAFLMRQMEFDADRYEARLVGCEVACSTFSGIFGLNLAAWQVRNRLPELLREERLGDRFAGLVIARYRELLVDMPQIYQEHVDQAKTGLFDSHPSMRERLASIEREAEAGVFTCDLPALALLTRFDAIDRACTLDFYRQVFAERFDEEALVPVEESSAAHRRMQEDEEVVERYLGRAPDSFWPFPLPQELPALAVDPAIALREAREAVAAQREVYATEARAHAKASERRHQAVAAAMALQAGYGVEAKEFGLTESQLSDINQVCEQARSDLGAAEACLHTLEEASVRRLLFALALRGSAGLESQLAGAALDTEEIQRRLACLTFLNRIYPRLHELADRSRRLGLLDQWNELGGLPKITPLHDEANGIVAVLQDLAGTLALQPYPLDDRGADWTLAVLAKLDRPVGREISDLRHATEILLETLLALYTRLLADLGRTAERVEEAVGFSSPIKAKMHARRGGQGRDPRCQEE